MGKVSELVGKVVNAKPVQDREIDGEQFFTIDVQFRDTTIPVLYSSCITDKEFEEGTKVRVTGCLMSDVKQKELPKFYFYANSIVSADMDEETTNEINFSCNVTKVKEISADSHCVDILPLVASDSTPLDTTSVLYLCARNGLARRLKNRERGYTITGRGYLKQFRDIYEVYITHVDNLSEILN